MCLAIPMKVKKVQKEGVVTAEGKKVDTSLITSELEVGDYLLVHNDLAVNKIAPDEAKKIIGVVSSCSHNHTHSHSHTH